MNSEIADRLDPLTPAARSERMSRVRNKNSKLEMLVRSTLHRMGYRYRLHSAKLPGRPDLVFPSRRKAIFVHGCFWHLHDDCRQYRIPRTRQEFWLPKLRENQRRDAENQDHLRRSGWEVLVVWECEMKKWEAVKSRIVCFLEKPIAIV